MALLSGSIGQNYTPDSEPRKENIMALECSDKKGLTIQGNGQLYTFKQGDAIPERIFTNDFPADSGKEFLNALIEAKRIKDVKEVKAEKKEGAK